MSSRSRRTDWNQQTLSWPDVLASAEEAVVVAPSVSAAALPRACRGTVVVPDQDAATQLQDRLSDQWDVRVPPDHAPDAGAEMRSRPSLRATLVLVRCADVVRLAVGTNCGVTDGRTRGWLREQRRCIATPALRGPMTKPLMRLAESLGVSQEVARVIDGVCLDKDHDGDDDGVDGDGDDDDDGDDGDDGDDSDGDAGRSARLIISIPGEYDAADPEIGANALALLPRGQPDSIACVEASTVGGAQHRWFVWFAQHVLGVSPTQLHVVYPSCLAAQHVLGGAQVVDALGLAYWDSARFLRAHLCDVTSADAPVTGTCIWRDSAWAYLGSHAFTGSSWGVPSQDSLRLSVRDWAVGVVVQPGLASVPELSRFRLHDRPWTGAAVPRRMPDGELCLQVMSGLLKRAWQSRVGPRGGTGFAVVSRAADALPDLTVAIPSRVVDAAGFGRSLPVGTCVRMEVLFAEPRKLGIPWVPQAVWLLQVEIPAEAEHVAASPTSPQASQQTASDDSVDDSRVHVVQAVFPLVPPAVVAATLRSCGHDVSRCLQQLQAQQSGPAAALHDSSPAEATSRESAAGMDPEHARAAARAVWRAQHYDEVVARKNAAETRLAEQSCPGTVSVTVDPDAAHHDLIPGELDALRLLKPGQCELFELLPKRHIDMTDPETRHYHAAEALFHRLCEGGDWYVRRVSYVVNPHSLGRFQHAQAVLSEKCGRRVLPILAFHGTDTKNIQPICETNFSIARVGAATGNMGYYGAGAYFSEYSSYSLPYIRNGNKILLCQVLLGKTYWCRGIEMGIPLKPGHHSHCSPDGRELVIFDSAQILPTYVIDYGRSANDVGSLYHDPYGKS